MEEIFEVFLVLGFSMLIVGMVFISIRIYGEQLILFYSESLIQFLIGCLAMTILAKIIRQQTINTKRNNKDTAKKKEKRNAKKRTIWKN